MENGPRDVLAGFIRRYGTGLIRDPVRCEGLLRDTCGDCGREVFVLVSALRCQVPSDLLAAYGRTSPEILYPLLARRLEERCAFEENAACWAVRSWAVALGLADAGTSTAPPHSPDPARKPDATGGDMPGRDIRERARADISESEEILAGNDLPGKLAFLRSLRDRTDPGETGILIRALGNRNWQVRYAAFGALLERGEDAGSQLIHALREREPGGDDDAGWRIVLLLGVAGNRDTVPVLTGLLENGNASPGELRAAVWALGEIGDPQAGEAILPLISGTDDGLREEAEEAIKKTGKKNVSSGPSSA